MGLPPDHMKSSVFLSIISTYTSCRNKSTCYLTYSKSTLLLKMKCQDTHIYMKIFTNNMKCRTILGWKGKALEAGKEKSVGAN